MRLFFTIASFFLALAWTALARDIRTLTGTVFREVVVTRVESTGIAITHKDGVSFLDFKILPPELQNEFQYNPAAYAAAQAQNSERDALLEIQRRATAAAAAAQRWADQEAVQFRIAEQQRAAQAAAAIQQRDYTTRNYSTPNYASRDYSTSRYSSDTYIPPTSSGGTVQVRGYFRKDGTYVKGYTRRK